MDADCGFVSTELHFWQFRHINQTTDELRKKKPNAYDVTGILILILFEILRKDNHRWFDEFLGSAFAVDERETGQ